MRIKENHLLIHETLETLDHAHRTIQCIKNERNRIEKELTDETQEEIKKVIKKLEDEYGGES
jgi:hypothetical protein